MSATPPNRRDHWDVLGVVIASLVGLLALVVAGYTAYIQREQVRAQVWPYLISGNNDLTQSLTVSNKGVGPAIVRSVRVIVDDKPQVDWDHVLVALGMQPNSYIMTTVNHGVLSPGEELQAIRFPDKQLWRQFHDATSGRVAIDICFCSTLGECWVSINEKVIGPKSMPLQLRVKPVGRCPQLSPAETFNN
ncbi:hypothetical protein [Rhodanobacter lindaniclasticus]